MVRYWTYLGIIEAGRYAQHKNPIAAEKMAVTEDNTETLFTKEQIKCTKSVALIVERSITPTIAHPSMKSGRIAPKAAK